MTCGTGEQGGGFASRALALGESLPMIGKLLGHSQVETTARYAHLARDSMQASAARARDCGQHRGRPSECQYQTYALYELKKIFLNQYGVICADQVRQIRLKPGARSRPLHCH